MLKEDYHQNLDEDEDEESGMLLGRDLEDDFEESLITLEEDSVLPLKGSLMGSMLLTGKKK